MENDNQRKLLAFLIAVVCVAGGYILLPSTRDLKTDVNNQKAEKFLSHFVTVTREAGLIFPDYAIPSREGRPVRLSAMAGGRVTLVNFWASWCAPCLEELPLLARFQEKHPDIMVLPVSLDSPAARSRIGEIFDKESLRHLRWYHDAEGDYKRALRPRALPATYLIGKNGTVIYALEGPADWSSSEADAFADMAVVNY